MQADISGKLFADEAAGLYERATTTVLKNCTLLYFAYADFEEVLHFSWSSLKSLSETCDFLFIKLLRMHVTDVCDDRCIKSSMKDTSVRRSVSLSVSLSVTRLNSAVRAVCVGSSGAVFAKSLWLLVLFLTLTYT